MPYTAEISRANPTCFLFLIDQSGSMSDPFGGAEAGKRKADVLADVINNLLQTIVLRCVKGEEVRDYFHVGVIGYGGSAAPALAGALAGKDLVTVSELANNQAREETRSRKEYDGAGGLTEQTVRMPIWFDPVASGKTPMCQALSLAKSLLTRFLAERPNCHPPVVMNITDGEATDGDPTPAMKEITSLKSNDGQVLLMNIHLSSQSGPPIVYPSTSDGLPDQYAQMLFGASSELTSGMREYASSQGLVLSPGARAFVFNSDPVTLIQALEIGTKATRNL